VRRANPRQKLARRDAPTKIAWLLEHQEQLRGLSFAALKTPTVRLATLAAKRSRARQLRAASR